MSVWTSLALGAAGLLMLWALVGLLVRGILGSVGHDISEMLDQQP